MECRWMHFENPCKETREKWKILVWSILRWLARYQPRLICHTIVIKWPLVSSDLWYHVTHLLLIRHTSTLLFALGLDHSQCDVVSRLSWRDKYATARNDISLSTFHLFLNKSFWFKCGSLQLYTFNFFVMFIFCLSYYLPTHQYDSLCYFLPWYPSEIVCNPERKRDLMWNFLHIFLLRFLQHNCRRTPISLYIMFFNVSYRISHGFWTRYIIGQIYATLYRMLRTTWKK